MKWKLVLFFVAIVLITGCESVSKVMDEESMFFRDVIEKLTSDEMRGRLTGTEGNDRTVQFLESQFKEIGLEPLVANNYLVAYPHQFYNPDELKFEIKLYDGSNEIRELVRGVDFLERSGFSSYDATFPVTFDIYDPNLTDSFLIVENSGNFNEYYDKVQGVLIVEDLFSRSLIIDQLEKPIVQINQQTYDSLKSESNIKLSITSHMEQEMIQAYNVAARIPGKDRTKAIILSAHFDHVGWVGETIYRGAVDNASGVAILLHLAQKVKKYSEGDGMFEKDIIIVGFNGEESGLQGSYHFAEFIKNEYEHIYNINLDSIYDGPLELHSGDEPAISELITDVEDYFENQKIALKTNLSLNATSDYASFLYQHINSVNLSSQDIRGKIHHPLDTSEQINFLFLAEVSEKLFQFLIQHDHKVYEHVHSPSDTVISPSESVDEEEQRRMKDLVESERQKLRFDEYKYIEIKDKEYYLVSNDRFTFNTIEELTTYYPNIIVQNAIRQYGIESIRVATINDEKKDLGDAEPNQIYKVERDSENIYLLGLKYSILDNQEKYVLDISITKDREIDVGHDHEDHLSTVKELLINGKSYNLSYVEERDIIYNLEFKKEVNGQIFTISVARGNEAVGELHGEEAIGIKADLTEEDVTEMIHSGELLDAVDKLLLSLTP